MPVSVYVQRAVTEVVPPASTDTPSGEEVDKRFAEAERLREALERREDLKRRTCARGFDD